MQRHEILNWLREPDDHRLAALWRQADEVRRRHVGDAVYLRGLIEISNHCRRQCWYCGLRAPNTRLPRYRLTTEEILGCARQAAARGYGTVVLQAGEDPALTRERIADVVRRIKAETPLAVTLSLGEQSYETLTAWREAGADRYLLRFETSNAALLARIHPPLAGQTRDRLAILPELRALGYEVGSGVMVGIPGQTYADLADDVALFRELDLDMIGVGPFLPHPDTPLGTAAGGNPANGEATGPGTAPDEHETGRHNGQPGQGQVPATELMTYKVIALARLACPRANIPSTTALATLNRAQGRELGLSRGANIVMPNLTPPEYRRLYEIYPAKACLTETVEQFHAALTARILSLGRTIGVGPGGSPNWRDRQLRPAAGSDHG